MNMLVKSAELECREPKSKSGIQFVPLWMIYQGGILPRILWPLLMYGFPYTTSGFKKESQLLPEEMVESVNVFE